MAQCIKYKTGERCPALHECVGGDEFTAGYKNEVIDGKDIQIRTAIDTGIAENVCGGKLEQYCFYCMATKRGKKIGNKASWTGSTPKWCPLGRDEV